MHARVQVEALVHGGIPHARRRTRKLGLRGLAALLGRLERASLHPRKRQRFARAVRWRLVRGVGVPQEAAASEPLHHAPVDVLPRLLQLLEAGPGRRLEAQRAGDLVLHVNAVETQNVEVDVHVEAGARSMHARASGPRLHTPRPVPCALRPARVAATQTLPEDTRAAPRVAWPRGLTARRGTPARTAARGPMESRSPPDAQRFRPCAGPRSSDTVPSACKRMRRPCPGGTRGTARERSRAKNPHTRGSLETPPPRTSARGPRTPRTHDARSPRGAPSPDRRAPSLADDAGHTEPQVATRPSLARRVPASRSCNCGRLATTPLALATWLLSADTCSVTAGLPRDLPARGGPRPRAQQLAPVSRAGWGHDASSSTSRLLMRREVIGSQELRPPWAARKAGVSPVSGCSSETRGRSDAFVMRGAARTSEVRVPALADFAMRPCGFPQWAARFAGGRLRIRDESDHSGQVPGRKAAAIAVIVPRNDPAVIRESAQDLDASYPGRGSRRSRDGFQVRQFPGHDREHSVGVGAVRRVSSHVSVRIFSQAAA